jgi:hypothetical protein
LMKWWMATVTRGIQLGGRRPLKLWKDSIL